MEMSFRISEKIDPVTVVFQEYVPPNGSTITLQEFFAEGAYTANSEARVVWDFEGDQEELLWTIKGSGTFRNRVKIENADGVKKIALVCDNGEQQPMTISAFMTITVQVTQ